MRIKEIQATIRRPTVQYGFDEVKYTIEIDEDNENIENVLRHLYAEHAAAMTSVIADEENRKQKASPEIWSSYQQEIPFN